MGIIRKVIRIGTSRAITIPPSWFKLIEKQTGKVVEEVSLEFNGSLNITPILKEAVL